MDNQQNTITNINQIPEKIRNYLESLLEEGRITTVPDEVREDMLRELYVKLDNYIASVILKNMPPEFADEFVKMNQEKKSREELEKFVQDKIPNANDVFARAFIDFRDLYLGNKPLSETQVTNSSDVAEEKNNFSINKISN